jgi:diphthine-ammonia ligase
MVTSENAFVSWSGGKDCSLACYRAIKAGIKVSYLINTVTEDGERSKSHGISSDLLKMQAAAMGIPMLQQATSDDTYEAEFKKAIATLKKHEITAGVFGDIDFNEHRIWIDRVCSDMGIKPYYPLWEEDQNKLLLEFIKAGFVTVVVATKAEVLGEEWLGRKLDLKFVEDLGRLGNITPCGEAGEYHTLVIDGPLFKKRLEIKKTQKILREGHWFLNIEDCLLGPK